jgi:anti-anti-sigma regulatory factor
MSDEFLHEHIGELEQALAAERALREEAEATIAGLRCIATAEGLDATDQALCSSLRPLLQYQYAAMLRGEGDPPELLRARVAELPVLADLRWREGPLRRRILAGQTVALYDVRKTPELAARLDAAELRSLLCVPLSIVGRPAVLIGTHERPAFFTTHHVALARRFAQTATRVLESLDAREHAQQAQLAEERATALARTNEALREQLDTIAAQRQQIEQLRAPVLLVAERTLVVPLIGEFDQDAFVDVIESLLRAVTAHRARTIIIDLTSFESPDLGAVARIESLARTTAMLGARCQLSGLRPTTAQALSSVSLGLRAHATLADALATQAAQGSTST